MTIGAAWRLAGHWYSRPLQDAMPGASRFFKVKPVAVRRSVLGASKAVPRVPCRDGLECYEISSSRVRGPQWCAALG
jgi:hypothetical protein